MQKKIFISFFTILLAIVLFTSIGFAGELNPVQYSSDSQNNNAPKTTLGGWFERFITNTVVAFFDPLKVLIIGDLGNLIMPPDGDTLSFYEANLLTKANVKITEKTMIFGDPEHNIMGVGERVRVLLLLIVGAMMPVTMVYSIIKYQNAITPDKRKKFIDFLIRWVVTFVLLIFSRQIMLAMYEVNAYIVNIIRYASAGQSGKVMSFMDNLNFSDFGLLWLVLWAAYKLLVGWIALVVFPMRDIIMILLYTLSPVLIYQFMFESRTEVTINWAREFFGTVITQSVYAFVFWVAGELLKFFDTAASLNTQLSFIRAIMIILFLTLMLGSNKVIREWLGLDTSGHDALQYIGMGALLGIGTMLFAGGLAKTISGALRGETGMANIPSATGGKIGGGGFTPASDEGTIAEVFRNAQVKASKYAAVAGKIASIGMATAGGIALGPAGMEIGETLGNAAGNFVVGKTLKGHFARKGLKELDDRVKTDKMYYPDYTALIKDREGNLKEERSVYAEGVRPYMSAEEQQFIYERNKRVSMAKAWLGEPAAFAVRTIYNIKGKNIPRAIDGPNDELLTEKVQPGDIFDVAYKGNIIEYYRVIEGQREKVPFHVSRTNKNYGSLTKWERYQVGEVVAKGHSSPLAWNKIHDMHLEDVEGRHIPLELPNSGRKPFLN
ncbi:hypothetical protein [Caldanaerobacter subterraneus]|uniref:Uncharacterized protein n=1 Tax=Caldanaerobacter subterraneus TaxID=911092 RepID=A0A7Y2PKQ9_9THEO|nr:hypothetical protein [Caldanaerobacter subterraneus]NNG66441.1 hypothetical protein [Caldanaerobacter subterraneus]